MYLTFSFKTNDDASTSGTGFYKYSQPKKQVYSLPSDVTQRTCTSNTFVSTPEYF